jgi:hypothetical protein
MEHSALIIEDIDSAICKMSRKWIEKLRASFEKETSYNHDADTLVIERFDYDDELKEKIELQPVIISFDLYLLLTRPICQDSSFGTFPIYDGLGKRISTKDSIDDFAYSLILEIAELLPKGESIKIYAAIANILEIIQSQALKYITKEKVVDSIHIDVLTNFLKRCEFYIRKHYSKELAIYELSGNPFIDTPHILFNLKSADALVSLMYLLERADLLKGEKKDFLPFVYQYFRFCNSKGEMAPQTATYKTFEEYYSKVERKTSGKGFNDLSERIQKMVSLNQSMLKS